MSPGYGNNDHNDDISYDEDVDSADFFLFYLIGIHSMQGWIATTMHGVTRKKAQKKIIGYRKSV